MSGLLGSCAACIACQACTCVSSSICSFLCGKLCSGNDSPKQETVVSRTSRLTYFFLFLVVVLATWIFRDNAPDTFTGNDIFSKNLNCPSNTKLNGCVARAFVLRLCFATSLFHLSLALPTIGVNDYSNPRIVLHTALWPIKLAWWAILHFIVFLIPSSFFLGFGWLALAFGVVFILVQIILYIEWVYQWNEDWIAKDGADNISGPYHIAIMIISLVCFGGSVVLTAFMFKWFGTDSSNSGQSCGLYLFFISWNLILFVFLTILSFRVSANLIGTLSTDH